MCFFVQVLLFRSPTLFQRVLSIRRLFFEHATAVDDFPSPNLNPAPFGGYSAPPEFRLRRRHCAECDQSQSRINPASSPSGVGRSTKWPTQDNAIPILTCRTSSTNRILQTSLSSIPTRGVRCPTSTIPTMPARVLTAHTAPAPTHFTPCLTRPKTAPRLQKPWAS